MHYKRAMAGATVAAVLVITGGCGKAAEKIAEEAAEEAIGGGEIDISGDGGVRITTPDGSSYEADADGNVVIKGPDGEVITADADGNMTMSGEDGDTSYATGENAELPGDWPDALALPDGTTLLTTSTTTTDGTTTVNVSGELSVTVKEAYDHFKDALDSGGYEITSDSLMESSDGDFASLSATKDEQQVSVSLSGSGDDAPFLNIQLDGA